MFFGSSSASACSCRGRASFGKNFQPCAAYWTAEAVFIGRAEKITVEDWEMKVEFSVERAIRGVGGAKTVEIFTSSNTAACGYPFERGATYFVYGRRGSNGKLTEGLCGPTVLLEKAQPDLEYAKEIEAGKNGSRIYGYVYENRRENQQALAAYVPLAGIEVVIQSGKKSFKTVTGADGFYVFKNAPPGIYRVTAKLPEGLREIAPNEDLARHYAVVNDKGFSCELENFTGTAQGSIRGTISGGSAASGTQKYLWLVPVDETGKAILESPAANVWMDPRGGAFYFNAVAPGRYQLVVNPRNCQENYAPALGRSFYPGVTDEAQAETIVVEQSRELKLRNYLLPPPRAPRWISGIVRSADRQPLKGAKVILRNEPQTYPNGCSDPVGEALTDEAGRFRIEAFEGYRYQIRAYEIKTDGRSPALVSKPSPVPARGAIDDLELIVDALY